MSPSHQFILLADIPLDGDDAAYRWISYVIVTNKYHHV